MNRLLLILSIVAFIFPGQWNFCDSFKANVCDKLSLFFGLRQELYSCVIECGDNKCRLVCYSFIPTRNGRNVRLHDNFDICTVQKVHEFVHDPEKFKETIDHLLEEAKGSIPKPLWHISPLILVGTSRFFDYMTKNKLECVKPIISCHLKATGFLVPQEPMVLLTDRNEGLFDWFTVNMMLGRLRQLKTVAVLNLELKSNQVTFVASEEEQKTEKYQPYITSEEFGTGKQFQIYSRSFPQLGIGEIRQKIIKKGTYEGGVYYPECMLPSYEGSWQYNGVTYRVAGSKRSSNSTLKSNVPNYTERGVDIEKCVSVVRQVLCRLPEVPSLAGREIFGLNSYFRTFDDAGFRDIWMTGFFSIKELTDYVMDICRQNKFKLDYLCMDLMYILLLLRDFYKLRPKDTIYLMGDIKEHEVEKTLGIAYLNLML
ncbi:hypothetical protein RUM44_008231 [Polyplax serrata]|uniref:Uncharacterized protein n=1 Tax=Polyplax serrata TaxID=468196 RepID=A0ABR1B9H7_POLSC